MSVEICERCHRLFTKTSKNICHNCLKEEEEAYKKVRMYIKRNKHLDMITVSKETGVSLDLIILFLQDGRIDMGGNEVTYPCKDCGAPIQSGAYCMDCQSEYSKREESIRQLADHTKQHIEITNKKSSAFHAKH